MGWKAGDLIRHRFNPDLGPGRVRAIEGRTLVVDFLESGTTLRIAADSDALESSRGMAPDDGSPIERLAAGDVDSLAAFSLRLDALHLAAVREADGLGSFLGGRIRLFPHQLHVAERATRGDPVRWLLADEVGLGKTVEACLVLNHLVHTARADRVLVVAPETLTVQWLGELWRKYHQVFVLLDAARLLDVERVYGRGFNPFEVHRRSVIGAEFLRDQPRLTELAVEAGVDLLIVDEAHHLRRPPGHPGNPAYRAVRPIADLGRHVLLLTATPLEEDAHGFFRLLQLLRPDEFPDDRALEERLASDRPLPPCTSATRRADVGGLPPRRPRRIEIEDAGWPVLDELVERLRAQPARDALQRRHKLERLRRAVASPAAVAGLLDAGPERELARRAAAQDPRLAWLARQAPEWKRAGDKTLVFVAHRESLESIRTEMSRRAQLRVGVFHEDLSLGQRDIEVAQFRLPSGPSLLVSTECGGEGRNFEFCTRLVLFDLPWNPLAVEQRIGRLDRIGRTIPVELLFLPPPSGLGAAIARLYESLGLFGRPMAGLDRELGPVEAAIERMALEGEPPAGALERIVERAESAYDRIQAAARHELHREPYRPERAASILARIPDDLDELTGEIVLGFAELVDLTLETHRSGARHSIELGHEALVGSLPGVPAGARFLGSFDREEAVRDEGIDFFASGHPLVEGILAHLDESPLGRVGLLDVGGGDEQDLGLLALYRRGAGFEAIAVDAAGSSRPAWARRLTDRPLRSRRVDARSWTAERGWSDLVRRLARSLPQDQRPAAVAVFRLRRPAGLRTGSAPRS